MTKEAIILLGSSIILILNACTAKIENPTEMDSIAELDTVPVNINAVPASLDSLALSFIEKAPRDPIFIHGIHPPIFQELAKKTLEIDPDAPQKLDLDKRYPRRGTVYLQEKEFSGSNVPFVGYVTDEIKSLYVNGVKISFTPNKEFFFRQTMDLYIGYNRIPIKIINKTGYVTESYLEITMERIPN